MRVRNVAKIIISYTVVVNTNIKHTTYYTNVHCMCNLQCNHMVYNNKAYKAMSF